VPTLIPKIVIDTKLCRAGFIVSGDKHLLGLKEYEGIRIVKAADFLSFFKRTFS